MSRQRCEYILFARPGPFASHHSLALDAYLILLRGLDFTGDDKVPTVAKGLDQTALAALGLEDVDPTLYPFLKMKTRFEGYGPAEIAISLHPQQDQERHIKLISYLNKRELYFWKRVGTLDDSRQDIITDFKEDDPQAPGIEWDHLPKKRAQVGFYVEHQDEYSVYVAVEQYAERTFQINIGIDVDCAKWTDYVSSSRFMERVKKQNRIVCRIPVLRFKGPLVLK